MAKDEIMLLPVLREIFEDFIMNGLAGCAHLNITKAKLPTTRWIITKLYSYFGEPVMFQCKHRYVGNNDYHKKLYLLKALSGILVQQKKVCGREKRVLPAMNSDHEASPSQSMNEGSAPQTTITEVAYHLNTKFQEQAKKKYY